MEEVIFKTEDRVAAITINRPDDENRMTPEVLERIGEIADLLSENMEIQAVILTGAGSTFLPIAPRDATQAPIVRLCAEAT